MRRRQREGTVSRRETGVLVSTMYLPVAIRINSASLNYSSSAIWKGFT